MSTSKCLATCIAASTMSAQGGLGPQVVLSARIAASNPGSREMTCRGLGVLTVSGRVASQAITCGHDSRHGSIVHPRIEPRDIRNESPILMSKRHQYKPVVPDGGAARQMPVGHCDTEFQRHVESGKVRIAFSPAT